MRRRENSVVFPRARGCQGGDTRSNLHHNTSGLDFRVVRRDSRVGRAMSYVFSLHEEGSVLPCLCRSEGLSLRPVWNESRCPRRLQSCSSTVCRTQAKTPCWSESPQAATPSESPAPVLSCEEEEEVDTSVASHPVKIMFSFLGHFSTIF
ncbi:unnamed protein product [Pleuronectes platessa]|uniref:Uncharacterized protein n=1 Tax=Pleuronectes platessa TaxID=8262 RepID=A0A9N7VNJ6_PLEPL|nr:unnamed protein product [Pleuronectes platessa]